ncbi:MAG TPA: dihydropteroate synthase [Spirochaetota bacterium]|jgi:dihydropteroate synthase|nr:dihydropteroate synthase [Spirochaetota bacterium]HPV42668.1 dihydropteroate synthase [Spirochaetota bacterium]
MDRVRIMGILNVTPDSFYDGGKYADAARAAERAFIMRDEGADIIDIGGESSRPGAKPVTAREEIDRVCPVIEKIAAGIGIPISIDTTKAAVARAALGAGASIINDISGLSFDDDMAAVAAGSGASLVLMHIQGTPETMQRDPRYGDLVGEIRGFLAAAAEKAVARGVGREKIIVDPGIGFGKTLEDNYRIIKNLHEFKELGFPVLVGLSRKSLIGKLYRAEEDRLPATIALNAASVLNGADIIRVHDVKEHRLALEALEMLKRIS